tara:strand:- start:2061 stop:2612 length:552 start_codon:yes stop_codon:yes gene_type:complete
MPIAADLTVEDGTGLAAANSYISLADTSTYHALRGNEEWADATESDQVVALVRATDYVESRWTFTGTPFTTTQALGFPMETIYLNNRGADVSETVPVEIEEATAEYALLVLGTGVALVDLSPAVDQTDPNAIEYFREKIGSLEEETHYDTKRGTKITLAYPTADKIIKASGYLAGGRTGGAIR